MWKCMGVLMINITIIVSFITYLIVVIIASSFDLMGIREFQHRWLGGNIIHQAGFIIIIIIVITKFILSKAWMDGWMNGALSKL